jgi:putative transposase
VHDSLPSKERRKEMASNMRKGHDAAFKARVALEALKSDKTMAQISSEYEVHVNQIRQWKQRLPDEIPNVFSDHRRKKAKDDEEMTSELYKQIGQLKVEVDWLKKKSMMLQLRRREK